MRRAIEMSMLEYDEQTRTTTSVADAAATQATMDVDAVRISIFYSNSSMYCYILILSYRMLMKI